MQTAFRNDLAAGLYKPLTPIKSAVIPGARLGRVLADGYARGVGLQYGDIVAKIEADPLFQHAAAMSADRSVVSPSRRQNLFLLITQYLGNLDAQNIIEFGSFRGGSAIFMGVLLKHLYPQAKVYALDTYEGMPVTDFNADSCPAGIFNETSLDELRAYLLSIGLDNVFPVKGLFQDTLDGVLAKGETFGLAHIDADIYTACKYAQDTIWPAMAPGGYLVYDDATDSACIGAMQAAEEMVRERGIHSEQVHPHLVFRAKM